MTARQILPLRRSAMTTMIKFRDREFAISIGYFDQCELQPAEVFISGTKAGSDLEAVARDAAVLLSIALQFSAPLGTIKHALTHEPDGKPSSIIGAIVDQMAGHHGLE